MLLPSVNPIKCHEEVLSLQPMISPKRFDIYFPDWGMLRRSRCVQMFFLNTIRKEKTYDVLSIQRENGNGTKILGKSDIAREYPPPQKKMKQNKKGRTVVR